VPDEVRSEGQRAARGVVDSAEGQRDEEHGGAEKQGAAGP
jgi:hypothetical protein